MFAKRPASVGSTPNSLKNAMSMGKKGGHSIKMPPPGLSKPSPAARLSAADM